MLNSKDVGPRCLPGCLPDGLLALPYRLSLSKLLSPAVLKWVQKLNYLYRKSEMIYTPDTGSPSSLTNRSLAVALLRLYESREG